MRTPEERAQIHRAKQQEELRLAENKEQASQAMRDEARKARQYEAGARQHARELRAEGRDDFADQREHQAKIHAEEQADATAQAIKYGLDAQHHRTNAERHEYDALHEELIGDDSFVIIPRADDKDTPPEEHEKWRRFNHLTQQGARHGSAERRAEVREGADQPATTTEPQPQTEDTLDKAIARAKADFSRAEDNLMEAQEELDEAQQRRNEARDAYEEAKEEVRKAEEETEEAEEELDEAQDRLDALLRARAEQQTKEKGEAR